MIEPFTKYVASYPDGDAVIEIWEDTATHQFTFEILRKGKRLSGGHMPFKTKADALDCAGRWLQAETESILFAWIFLALSGALVIFAIYFILIGAGVITAGWL
jgi:hypothetical protein